MDLPSGFVLSKHAQQPFPSQGLERNRTVQSVHSRHHKSDYLIKWFVSHHFVRFWTIWIIILLNNLIIWLYLTQFWPKVLCVWLSGMRHIFNSLSWSDTLSLLATKDSWKARHYLLIFKNLKCSVRCTNELR